MFTADDTRKERDQDVAWVWDDTALRKRLHRASRNQSLFVVRWSVV